MKAAKRTLDLLGSGLGLIVLLPVLGVVASAIWREDRGPIFFWQTRIGRRGEPFKIWKFRTMVVDAESMGPSVTPAGDNRVTRVGRTLRHFKLDELPQIVNVVLGQMSLVGPRPEVPRFVRAYTEEQRAVLQFVPGMTDPASLVFINEEEVLARSGQAERVYVEEIMPKKVALNLEYAVRATIWTDLWVIAKTIARILSLPRVRPWLSAGK